jgi:hypothetical protein
MSEAAASAAVIAAIANAIKASGVIVHVSQEDFQKILLLSESPLVICATGGFISKTYRYMTSYKGFAFFTKCPVPLAFPPRTETILAKKIWIPG